MLYAGQKLTKKQITSEVIDELNANNLMLKDINDGDYIYEVAQAPKIAKNYIPSSSQSVNFLMRSLLKANASTMSADEKIVASGIVEEWKSGKYEKGDLRNANNQTYECIQAHDNAIYPDINPDNASTWATFWKPLHGITPETARPWVKPQNGTTDMYLVGEYMVWTDGKTYKCLRNTVYSPTEYAADWEVVKN